jgi:hypothetical protein
MITGIRFVSLIIDLFIKNLEITDIEIGLI